VTDQGLTSIIRGCADSRRLPAERPASFGASHTVRPPDPLRLGLVSDLHWAPKSVRRAAWHNPFDFGGLAERVARAAKRLEQEGVDLIVVAGDLAHLGDGESQLAAIRALRRSARSPLLLVSGNHDASGDRDGLHGVVEAARSASAGDAIEGVEIAPPSGTIRNDFRLVGVHVAEAAGWFGARLRSRPDIRAWSDDLVVLVSHYPLLSRAALLVTNGFAHPADLIDGGDLANELLGRRGPTLVLSGHLHVRDSCARGSVLQLTQGAMIEPPFECSVVQLEIVTTGGITISRKSLPLAPSDVGRIPVFVDANETWVYRDGRWEMSQGRTWEALPRETAAAPE